MLLKLAYCLGKSHRILVKINVFFDYLLNLLLLLNSYCFTNDELLESVEELLNDDILKTSLPKSFNGFRRQESMKS